MISSLIKFFLGSLFFFWSLWASAQMNQIFDFGGNPGNLEMYLFEPSTPKSDAAVVLVLHGCGQNALNFAEQTGWNVLAERHGFYVIFAQQKAINNPNKCFNWFRNSDNVRGSGEAQSLAEMVAYVHDNFSTNPSRSFVCGLSAGGAMTPVVLACYPDIFQSGGTWAGVPYLYTPAGNNNLTPMQWGDKVRNAYPSYTGLYPTLFICQGTADMITAPINEARLIDQWTDVHNADQQVDIVDSSFLGNTNVLEKTYLNNNLDTIVKSYVVKDMEHGIAVDPGTGPFQGGQTSLGAFDVDFYSTYWMAKFFGILSTDSMSAVQELDETEIQIGRLQDGSLLISNASRFKNLEVNIHDMLGRVVLRENLQHELIVPSRELRVNKIFLLSITDRRKKRVYARLIKL